ncbi:MAG: ABC transporter permease [Caldilineaceae bacterium]|nr:ABC transporter permease [Caldilineaceae bacterium]
MATTLSPAQSQPGANQAQSTNWLKALLDSYLLRKLLRTLFTIFVVTTITFFLIRLLPGNPVEIYVNQLVVTYGLPLHEARDQAASLFAFDLDQPLYLQYFSFLGSLLQGNLGSSILSPGTPVSAIIARFLPWTIFSVGLGLIISFVIGMALGVLMAYRRESLLDHGLTVVSSIISSVPDFLIGLLIVVWLGVQWKLLPIAAMRGAYSSNIVPGFNWPFIQDAFFHAILPITTYVLTSVGFWMLSMKSSTVSTLGEDYVTVAKARGLKEQRITTAYVGRNAALPLFTLLTIRIGFVVGGSILVEQIFEYGGIGRQLGQAIGQRDYTVMQGIFLIITFSVIFANFFADILYSWLDPRIKLGSKE